MSERRPHDPPAALAEILRESERVGFASGSDELTGRLLRSLAASKPAGRLLELGTGAGAATAWILDGMDQSARLESVDVDDKVQSIARCVLSGDSRCGFLLRDAASFLADAPRGVYDLIFSDSRAGKFTHLDEAISLLAPGGIYVVDDLSPQPSWPQGHQLKVDQLRETLRAMGEIHVVELNWSTGLLLAVRRPG